MAPAARPARGLEPAPSTARRILASAVALGLALAPCAARAEPSEAPDAEPAAEPDVESTSSDEAAEPDATEPTPSEETSPEEDGNPDETEPELDASTALDEEEDDDAELEDEPPQGEPLRPLQTAAWWTMFGAFSVGTTAGVLAGLAERQEDRATRLSTLFDAETGAQPRYADRQDEYEGYLRRGEAYARAAIGVGVIAGVTTIAAITLFAIDARRQRAEAPRERARASLRVRPGGMEVRF